MQDVMRGDADQKVVSKKVVVGVNEKRKKEKEEEDAKMCETVAGRTTTIHRGCSFLNGNVWCMN